MDLKRIKKIADTIRKCLLCNRTLPLPDVIFLYDCLKQVLGDLHLNRRRAHELENENAQLIITQKRLTRDIVCHACYFDKFAIPEGAERIEAFVSKENNTIVILGDPDMIPDHDCDQMGCSADHVILRISLK